jgi:hypothetical protein
LADAPVKFKRENTRGAAVVEDFHFWATVFPAFLNYGQTT